jgi:hypothetical protein
MCKYQVPEKALILGREPGYSPHRQSSVLGIWQLLAMPSIHVKGKGNNIPSRDARNFIINSSCRVELIASGWKRN